MKRKNKLMGLILILTLLLSVPSYADESVKIIYAEVPEDWSTPQLWAWGDDGTNVFEAWPGGVMLEDAENPGWYYLHVPVWATNVIVNANEGGVQTSDYSIGEVDVWITVKDSDTVEISDSKLTTGELPVYTPMIDVYVKVPESWETVGLWAWLHPDGTNAFAAWPGETMVQKPDGWFVAKAPAWINSIIINGNEGTVQTGDMSIESKNVWVTVGEDGSSEFVYEAPAVVAETVRIHAKAPSDWLNINIWAWSHPDGTNVFPTWPGEVMIEDGEGWFIYEVPNWVNSIIINGNDGTIQTGDMSVDAGKDVWIVINDENTYEFDYSPIEEAINVETTEIAKPDPLPENDGDNGMMSLLLLAGAVAAGGGMFVYKKRKK